jgi:hypothetical protein
MSSEMHAIGLSVLRGSSSADGDFLARSWRALGSPIIHRTFKAVKVHIPLDAEQLPHIPFFSEIPRSTSATHFISICRYQGKTNQFLAAMYLPWGLSLLLLAKQTLALAVVIQNSPQESLAATADLLTMREPGYPASSGPPLLSKCALNLFDLKKSDYSTIFDGAYGPESTNILLTLCSDEGKQIPWKRPGRFAFSYLDHVAQWCCSDMINGVETVTFKDMSSDSVPFWKIFFLSASLCCTLYIVRLVSKRKQEFEL